MQMQNDKSDPNSNPRTYRTPDLYLSAFLLAKGIALINTEQAEGRTVFVFQDDGGVAQLARDYLGNASIPALGYKSCIRELKSLLHGGFRGRR
jgi:hypothetical protein